MSTFTFCKLDKTNAASILPQMFRILYTNMTKIAPTGCTYEEDEAMWLSYASEQMTKEYPEYILMYKDDATRRASPERFRRGSIYDHSNHHRGFRDTWEIVARRGLKTK